MGTHYYEHKTIRQNVVRREKQPGLRFGWMWILHLACGHVVKRTPAALGETCRRAMCEDCMKAAQTIEKSDT